MQRINAEPRRIPHAPDGRQLVQRLDALVGERSHSVHRFSGDQESTAAHLRTFDLVRRFAEEDAKAGSINFKTGAFEMGTPWMILSNRPIPSEFGNTGGPHPFTPDVTIFVHSDIAHAQDDNQHALIVDGDRLIGRGTADMKHAFLAASMALAHAPDDLHVAVVGYPDEEIGSQTFYHLMDAGLSTQIAIQMDGEPIPDGGSNISFVRASKATGRFHVGLPDRQPLPAAHSSRPHEAESALEDRAMPFIQEVRRPRSRGGAGIPKRRQRAPQATTFVPKISRSENHPTSTSHDIELHCELRTVDVDRFYAELDRVRVAAANNGLEVHDPYVVWSEYSQDPQVAEVMLYRSIGEATMGSRMDIRTDTGGNDLVKLPKETVTILSGIRGGDFHGPNEWVSLTAMQHAAQIQAAYMQQLPAILARQNGRAI